MRTMLKTAGASTLAAATIFTGLSFSPSATASPAPPSPSASPQASISANPANGTRFKLATPIQAGLFGSLDLRTDTTSFRPYRTRAEAEAKTQEFVVTTSGTGFKIVGAPGTGRAGQCVSSNTSFIELWTPYCGEPRAIWTLDSQGRIYNPAIKVYISQRIHSDNQLEVTTTGAAAQFSGINTGIEAKVDKVDLTTRSASISGTARPNSKVVIGESQEASVDSSGKWSATLTGLNFGANTIHLENLVGATKTSETDLTVTLAVAALTATAAAGASNTDDVAVSGAGQQGAVVTIKDAAGKPLATTTVSTAGRYSTTVAAPNTAGNQAFTVTQAIGGVDATTVNVTFDYGTGISIVSPVNDAIHPGGPLNFSGRGQSGGTVTIREQGTQDALASGTVLANGSWAINGVDLDEKEHKLVVSQLAKGNNTTTAEITLSPGASEVIVAPTVSTPTAGSTVNESRPKFSGLGEPGAKLTIGYGKNLIGTTTVNNAGEWAISPTSGLSLGKSDLTVTQTSGTDVKTIQHEINRIAATPFALSSHANNDTYAEGVSTFRGTGAEGATVTAKNQWGNLMGTAKVTNGQWTFNRNLGPTTDGYDITFTEALSGKSTDIKVHLVFAGTLSLQVTSPLNNSTYIEGDTTFTGRALPGTTIKATNQWGTPMGTATTGLNGNWSFIRHLGPTRAGYDITFTATKGTDTQRTQIHLNPVRVNAPVAVTSISDGDTYRPGLNTLTGTGTVGATVTAVNATNGWNVPMGSATVDANAKWSLPERNWGPSNDYQILVTQTNPDKTTSTAAVNVKAPIFEALSVTSPKVGDTYQNGVAVRFTGTATPFATVTVRSAASSAVYTTVVADSKGDWSFDRAWGPDHTYTLIFDQKALDGKTDSVSGFVWAANASK